MAFKEIAQLTLTQGSAVVNVVSGELLTDVVRGDYLEIVGALAKQVVSADNTARTITLSSAWGPATALNVAAIIRPTSADFRDSIKEVAGLSSLATQSISQWDALANTVTTVTITLPDESTVTIPSIPKAIEDASGLQANAQAAIDLMGDAPTFAQQVSDDKNTVFSYLTTAEDVAIDTGVYSLLHYSAKATKAKDDAVVAQGLSEDARDLSQEYASHPHNTAIPVVGGYSSLHYKIEAETAKTGAQTAQSLSEDARDLSQEYASHPFNVAIPVVGGFSSLHYNTLAQTAKADAEQAVTDSQTAQGLAEAARDKASEWADKATEVEPGRYAAKYWAEQAEAITGTANYVLKTRTINGYDLSEDRDLDADDVGAIASGAFGIGVTDLPDVVGDANTLNESGSVTYLGGGSTNLPSGTTDGFVHVLGNNANNNQIQLFVQQHQSRMWIRYCNTGVFGAWVEFYSTGNLQTELNNLDADIKRARRLALAGI